MLGTLLYIIIIIIAIIVIVALLRFVFQLFLIGPAGIETLDHEIFNRLIFSFELSHQEATIWDTQYQIRKGEYFSVSEVPLLMQHRIVEVNNSNRTILPWDGYCITANPDHNVNTNHEPQSLLARTVHYLMPYIPSKCNEILLAILWLLTSSSCFLLAILDMSYYY